MDILNSNSCFKILEIKKMSWDKSNVFVSARPYHALAYRLKGNAIFKINDTNVETNTGDVLLMPANTGYYAEYPEKNEILVIHFYSDDLLDLKNYTISSEYIIQSVFKKAYDIWNGKQRAFYYESTAKLYEILSSIDKLIQKENPRKNTNFFKAIEYINNNFTNPDISVEMLSSMSNMSSTYFRKLTVDNFNQTPSSYILNLRLSYAEKLLSTGKYTVNEVSDMSGFNDPKYFSRVVRKVYGCPPSKLYIHYK